MNSRMIGTVAAFALAVVSALTVTADEKMLPSGYTKLAYIASTGTQYIDTGCYPSDRLSITMDLGHFRWNGGNDNLFGSFNNQNNFYCAFVDCANSNYGQKQLKFVGPANGTLVDTGVADWAVSDVRIVIDGGDGTKNASNKYVGTLSVSVNGGTPNVAEVETSAAHIAGYPICVFSRGTGADATAFRLYGMTATKADGGTLFDLVPCISPDGEIGVYDLAGKRFLGNSGTGSFLTPSDAAQDLIKNGGFDIGKIDPSKGWSYRSTAADFCPNWSFVSANTGLTQPGTSWTAWNQPIGRYAAFLQRQSTDMIIEQTFTVVCPGDYLLSFDHAARNSTASTSHVRLYDASENLVGGISTEVRGSTTLQASTVSYAGLAAGTYTLRLSLDSTTGNGDCIFDNVSFTPATRILEEGDGLFLFDGDTTLNAALLAEKTSVTKNGTGAVIASSACAALPEMRIGKGAFSAQDGVATAYTVDGALALGEGTVLAIDIANGACDTFAATSLMIKGAMTLKVAGGTTDEMCGRSFVVFPGVSLTDSDLAKITLDAALPLELGLNASSELVVKVVLPAGYTKLAYIASTGTQYIDTGCYPSDRLSITMDLGHFRWNGGNDNLFGSFNNQNNFYCAFVDCANSNYGQKQLKFVGPANGTLVDMGVADWAVSDVRIVIDGGDGTKNASNKYVGTLSVSVNGGTPNVAEVETSAAHIAGYPICVFSRGAGSDATAFRLYGMTATKADGGTLFDLVPCISPDGEIGVYDLAGGRFLGNSGTGSFLTPSDAAQDLVKNGGFDIGKIDPSKGWSYRSTDADYCPNWSFVSANTGLTQPGTSWTAWNQPIGRYAAFLQRQSTDMIIEQTFTVVRPGDYRLSFDHAARNSTASTSHVRLYDASENLVGGISTEVRGTTTLQTSTVSYAGLAAGTYTLRISLDSTAGNGDCIFDNVSFTPVVRTVEEGGGVYLFEGDHVLTASLIEGKAFVNKSGAGELVAPAALGALPSIRVPASAFSAQDDVATAYTVNGSLMLKGGSTLKVDVTATGCDTFAVTGLSTGSASSSDRIFVSVSGTGVAGGSVSRKMLLVSGAGLSANDAKKFRVTGARGRCVVENGDLYLDAPKGLLVVVQ